MKRTALNESWPFVCGRPGAWEIILYDFGFLFYIFAACFVFISFLFYFILYCFILCYIIMYFTVYCIALHCSDFFARCSSSHLASIAGRHGHSAECLGGALCRPRSSSCLLWQLGNSFCFGFASSPARTAANQRLFFEWCWAKPTTKPSRHCPPRWWGSQSLRQWLSQRLGRPWDSRCRKQILLRCGT